MITERTGDLLKQQDLDAMVHQCNCYHCMGGGIARAIARLWPNVEEADNGTKYGDRAKLGTFSRAKAEDLDMWVYNMYSQFDHGTGSCHTDYTAMRKGLKAIIEDLRAEYLGGQKVLLGAPFQLGSGLAGGDWDKVRGILWDLFLDLEDIELVIVKLP